MRFGSAHAARAYIYNPQGIYFSHIFAKNKHMKAVKKQKRMDRAKKRLSKKLDRLDRRYEKGMDPGKYLDKVDKKGSRALKKVKR